MSPLASKATYPRDNSLDPGRVSIRGHSEGVVRTTRWPLMGRTNRLWRSHLFRQVRKKGSKRAGLAPHYRTLDREQTGPFCSTFPNPANGNVKTCLRQDEISEA